ncbi:hypothetical protein [Micromonospora aurantiaca (nom. illeg.)]|uniref:hypothetical protein n=1 Tax=Micromonospora aurantiaca (nom. illeg.) TaxID=47850 RepID=UPI0011A05176|nr:hypothetical protein [Micromonospora aurantiaca]MBC9000479.1 hypothetical protein [Micromonospora aurantiaca]
MDGFGFAIAVMGLAPGILLTGAVVHLRRRGRVTRAAVAMVAAITAVSAAGAVVQLLPGPSPLWLPWATAAASLVIGYGFLTHQLVRDRSTIARKRPAR